MNKFASKFLSLLPDWFLWTAFYILLQFATQYLLVSWNIQGGLVVNLLVSVAALFLAISVRIMWDEYIDAKAAGRDKELSEREDVLESEVKKLKERMENLNKDKK